ncbi:MAG: hypothetical protein U0P48_12330 [Ancrocorticia sp.]
MEFDKPRPPRGSEPTPEEFLPSLIPWIHGSRWHMEETGTITLAAQCEIAQEGNDRTLWLVIASGERLYNVPVVVATSATKNDDDVTQGLIATVGSWSLYDATSHPLGQRALFSLLVDREGAEKTPDTTGDSLFNHGEKTFSFTSLPLHGLSGPVSTAQRLTSEQSNTSIIYHFNDQTPIIIKLFRVLASGHNPDVELQLALDASGTVPRQYGSVRMRYQSKTAQTGEQGAISAGREDAVVVDGVDAVDEADVLVAQEFLEGAKDAWQVISDELAHTGGSLGEMEESIRALGSLTRTIHDGLASVFPVVPASSERRAALRHSWRERAHSAIKLVPELSAHEGTIEIMYSATEHVHWPELQRIHGDYHLGQVLEVPGRGWFALDFEGEPLRPMAERTREDLALRDVAGMLRSFDYAAGSAQMAGGAPEAIEEWARSAKEIFLSGYGELSEEEMVLLEALVLDKALYEVVYEATERPAWLPIPLAGISQLMGSASD